MPKPRHTCPRCEYRYPLSVSFNSVAYARAGVPLRYSEEVCGVCALEITNDVHGAHETHFHGEMAEMVRLDAENARKSGAAFPPQVAAK